MIESLCRTTRMFFHLRNLKGAETHAGAAGVSSAPDDTREEVEEGGMQMNQPGSFLGAVLPPALSSKSMMERLIDAKEESCFIRDQLIQKVKSELHDVVETIFDAHVDVIDLFNREIAEAGGIDRLISHSAEAVGFAMVAASV